MAKELQIVHPNAAGIDVGSREFYVDAGENSYRVFPTYTSGCHELRDYLLSQGVTTVALESTGVYWIALYDILETSGLEVYVVNGRHVRNVPGRKSDAKDCQWLRQLHSYGLLRKSFIPEDIIRRLRGFVRLRQDHIRAVATQVHLMQKALTLMNIRITEVLNDITGVSGMRMIEAILGGERNPEVLVELCHDSILKRKREQVVEALRGHYRPEHLFALGQARKTREHYLSMISECDKEIEALLREATSKKPDYPSPRPPKPIRYNKPEVEDLHGLMLKLAEGKDPTTIGGITDYSFLQLVAEIGTDMSAWKNEKQFVSWLNLAPLKASSGRTSRPVRRKNTNKAGMLFRNLGQGLLTSKHIAIGAFGRRIRAKSGSAVAIKAIARKLACYYYRVMRHGVGFAERGLQSYEEKLLERSRRALEKLAKKHNMQLIPLEVDSCP